MFVTVQIDATTQRGIRATAYAVALGLLSFLLLSALCAMDVHAAPQAVHAPASSSAHAAEPSSAEHCHHGRGHDHSRATLDRAATRTESSVDSGHCGGTSTPDASPTLHSGQPSARSSTGGPPRSGRALLITLSVARN